MSILSLQVTGDRLVVADVTVKSFEFRVVAVYAPNSISKRRSFFPTVGAVPWWFKTDKSSRRLECDLEPKIDKAEKGARGSDRYESSLIDLIAQHDLVDRFHLDHPGREMWAWLDSSPSVRIRIYLDRVIVRSADTEFVRCPTFHWIGLSDNKLVRSVCGLLIGLVWPASGSSIPPYWRYGTSGCDWKP